MLLSSRCVVGRDESSDVVLSGTEVSRSHAEFRVDGPIVAIRDLDSRNGVFVDGVRREDARLEIGSIVRCGEWVGALISSNQDEDPLAFGEIAPDLFGGTQLRKALEPAKRIASNPHVMNVIVQGMTGTGKEGTAKAVHGWSGRSGQFVSVNCATIPESLADAHLFGHSKGAFTGAEKATRGLFREADGGSLFLDEVLELPLALQAKLLRVIDEKIVYPLGESRGIPIDVRVIVAAQEPLEDAVAKGKFRADLFARLHGLTLILPPLCQRREDIVPLFLHFLRQNGRESVEHIEAKLVEALCLYDWPMNVRELMVLALRLSQLYGPKDPLRKAYLPESMLPSAAEPSRSPDAASSRDVSGPVTPRARKKTDDESEFEKLVAALHMCGTVAKAAAEIGVSRARAYRLLSAHPEFSLPKQDR
jgi:transcriptional regulator with PAS, ATPase and Fis domain